VLGSGLLGVGSGTPFCTSPRGRLAGGAFWAFVELIESFLGQPVVVYIPLVLCSHLYGLSGLGQAFLAEVSESLLDSNQYKDGHGNEEDIQEEGLAIQTLVRLDDADGLVEHSILEDVSLCVVIVEVDHKAEWASMEGLARGEGYSRVASRDGSTRRSKRTAVKFWM